MPSAAELVAELHRRQNEMYSGVAVEALGLHLRVNLLDDPIASDPPEAARLRC